MRRASQAAICALAISCGNNDLDPEAAETLLANLRAEQYKTKYFRPPGFEMPKASTAPHGDEVAIFVNDKVAGIFASKIAVSEWPEGSIIVKDGYEEGQLTTISAMLKRSDGWFWAEWDAESSESLASGKPELCTDCHKDGADFVKGFKFPPTDG